MFGKHHKGIMFAVLYLGFELEHSIEPSSTPLALARCMRCSCLTLCAMNKGAKSCDKVDCLHLFGCAGNS